MFLYMAYVIYVYVPYGIIVIFRENSEYPICVGQVVTFTDYTWEQDLCCYHPWVVILSCM